MVSNQLLSQIKFATKSPLQKALLAQTQEIENDREVINSRKLIFEEVQDAPNCYDIEELSEIGDSDEAGPDDGMQLMLGGT